MMPDYSSAVGGKGGIASSGKSIYDSLHDSPEFFLAGGNLEAILHAGLVGMNLNYPLRTRSKVLKSKICEVLGYPVPASFKKSKPRFPGQDFDTYIQKSNNLQIWNEEITLTRRYVIIRLDDDSKWRRPSRDGRIAGEAGHHWNADKEIPGQKSLTDLAIRAGLTVRLVFRSRRDCCVVESQTEFASERKSQFLGGF